jgi:hydrogenase-4 component E
MANSVPSPSLAVTGALAIAVLLTQFALLRTLSIEGVVRIYAIQSLGVGLFTVALASFTGNIDLYFLGGLTLVIKVVIIPVVTDAIVSRLGIEDRIRISVPVPQSFLLGAAFAALGFVAATRIHVVIVGAPVGSLGAGMAIVLMGFFLMTARPNAVVQLIGFLTLENGVFIASLSLAPSLPLLVAVLLLFDVLIPAAAFTVVIRVLAVRVRSAHTDELTELRG